MQHTVDESVIVEAKRASYVGHGGFIQSCRTGSHDVGWQSGPWRYLDSYFGGTDFSGQEVLWCEERPVWAMAYHGFVLDEQLIDAARAGAVIRAALSALYAEGRFLGGYRHEHEFGLYSDTSRGDWRRFTGREWIEVAGKPVYELFYHGGRIKD